MFTREPAITVPSQDISAACRALADQGLVLCPTDTIWSIVCDATDPVSVERLLRLKQAAAIYECELLTDSIRMLKDYVVHLHPRLETLLAYHVRPLTVLTGRGKNLPARLLNAETELPVRIAQDDYCALLVSSYGKPLLATYAHLSGHPIPLNFGGISSDVIQGVDYVARHRRSDKQPGETSVVVRLSPNEGELDFLRD